MLTPRASPPLARPSRSSAKRRSIQNMTPPVPLWDGIAVSTPPIPAREKREKHLYNTHSLDSPISNSPRLSPRPAYDVTSPRPRSTPRPALMTPPVIAPISVPSTSRRPKLLPAIPLEVDTSATIHSTPRSRRSVVINGYDHDNGVQIVINGRSSPTFSAVSPSKRERRSSTTSRRTEGSLSSPVPPVSPDIRERSPSTSSRRAERDILGHPGPISPVPPISPNPRERRSSTSSRRTERDRDTSGYPSPVPPISPNPRERRSSTSSRRIEASSTESIPLTPTPLPITPNTREFPSSSSSRRTDASTASITPTPPRPARRRRDSQISPRQVELFPPQSDFSRASSPCDSFSTITDAPTPRATPRADEGKGGSSKRDSTQRRLDALRGLVANLDFNQPWSMTDEGMASNENRTFWSSPEIQETLHSPAPIPPPAPIHRSLYTSPSQTSLHISQPFPLPDYSQPSTQDHGWESRPRPSRSEANLHTPTRVRKELFNVASSGYSKSIDPTSAPAPPTPETTWRSSLSSDSTFYRVLETRGQDEIKRQEVMWEMCETEQAFLKSMRNVLRLFATPLKTPQGKWIDGIPERISDLFDCLESVAHVHSVIAAVQRDMRRKSEVVDINAFVKALKGWVPKLEVYEWYLLRFEPVVALVEDHIRDPGSVFGEFVRMQLKEEILGSMSLGSMLLKPVQRLMKYPLFLKRLLDVTPCHPELLSLLASTESIILTLQATKAKEEDYDQLLSLESRLSGLPTDFLLAQRGRKLTGYGSVQRVYPNSFPNMMTSSRSSVSSSISSVSSPWDTAYSPSTCRSSSFSVSSVSSGAPSRSGSLRMSPSGFSTSPRRGSIYRSPSSASSTGGNDGSRPSTPSGRRRSKDELALFVFDDLVILAIPSERAGIFSSKSKKEKGWKVLPENEGGVGKLVEVKDWSGFGGHAALFVLTILPISSQPLQPVTICLTIPSPASPRATSRLPSLNCTTLTTLPQFLNALAQATTAGPGDASVYMEEKEQEEVLYPHHYEQESGGYYGDRVEIALDDGDEHPLHSLRALGYAQ